MERKQSVKPPTWFWIVSVLALIWNFMGVGQYLAQAFITDEAKALMTVDQLKLLEETPSWLTAIFALAVWTGLKMGKKCILYFFISCNYANGLFYIYDKCRRGLWHHSASNGSSGNYYCSPTLLFCQSFY